MLSKISCKSLRITDASLISTGKKNQLGVDYSDQMSSYHTCIRKTFKWYSKVIFEVILGNCVVNAWIVYNMMATTKLGITEFRQQLAKELIKPQKDTDALITRPNTPKKQAHTYVKLEGPDRKNGKYAEDVTNS